MNATTKQAIIEQANRDHAQYPQYRGHWDGPEWILVRFKKAIKTKMGLAFERGDVTVARADRGGDSKYITAYSFRNRIDTSVPLKAVVAD